MPAGRPLAAVLLALGATFGAPLGPAAAEPAASAVIDRQIEAFRRDALDEAFAFAHPSIQELFGTPERFGAMVRQGYPMIWRPKSYRLLDARPAGRGVELRLLFEDASGAPHVARYLMTQVDGAWRIAGVRLERPADAGA